MSADAFHVTAPPPDGDGAVRVMRNACAMPASSRSKSNTSTRTALPPMLGDRAETAAIKRCFGEHAYKVAVSSTKSMTGHLLGGAGGLEAGITVLAIRDQVAPPTINYETPDPECDLDYVPNQARPMRIDYALSNSFGFGGTNGASHLQTLF
jgi:3-oxoacyl-[acyl-carrier-protein] synthase II